MKYLRPFIILAAAIVLSVIAYDVTAQVVQPSCKVGIDGGKLAPYMPRYVKGNSGEHVYYFCVRPDGRTVTEGFSCPFTVGECGIGAFSSRMAGVMAAADRPAAAASAWASAFTYTCNAEIRAEASDRGRMCAERKAIQDANYATWTAGLVQPTPPTPPASAPPAGPSTWRTPMTGTFTLYTTANGALGATVPLRKATANALCNCNTNKVVRLTTTYCALDVGAAAEVTLCREVK